MPSISKEINKNNFIRWRKLEGVTLNDLQVGGIPSDELAIDDGVCGLSIVVQTDYSIEPAQVRAYAQFSGESFDVDMRIIGDNGDPITGFDWQEIVRLFAELNAGNYTIEARKQSNPLCQATYALTVTKICGISVDLIQLGGNIVATASYPNGVFTTEWQIVVINGNSQSASNWQALPEFSADNLPAGRYQLNARRSDFTSCAIGTPFEVIGDNLVLSNWRGINLSQISQSGSITFTLRNNGSSTNDALLTLSNPLLKSASLQFRASISGNFYNNPTTISLAAGETRNITIDFINSSGVSQSVSLSLQDQNPTSQGINVPENGNSVFVQKPEVFFSVNANNNQL